MMPTLVNGIELAWQKYAAAQVARFAAVGMTYPITEMPSEIVALAMMSKKDSPSEYASEE